MQHSRPPRLRRPTCHRVLDAMMLDVAEAVQALSRATRAERVRRRVAEMRDVRLDAMQSVVAQSRAAHEVMT